MGTRSLTRIIPIVHYKNNNKLDEAHIFSDKSTFHKDINKSFINLYRQYDGYPTYWGVKLAQYFNTIKIGNGIVMVKDGKVAVPPKLNTYANGIDCLAAQFVKWAKKEVGGVYLLPHNKNTGACNYIYTILPEEGKETMISIYDNYNSYVLFYGSCKDAIDKYYDVELEEVLQDD
jgi:hypothetical protein